ncbi:MAG: hypothetical protein WCO68_02195 [Verrucomicrobiota bacterium]
MSHLSYFFARIPSALVAVLLASPFSTGLCATQSLPDETLLKYEAPSHSEEQENAEQLVYIEHISTATSQRNRNVAMVLGVLFLFGAFCALWAQNTARNSFHWFWIGFLLNLGAVLLILWMNPRKRKKRVRKYRAVMDFWNLVQR